VLRTELPRRVVPTYDARGTPDIRRTSMSLAAKLESRKIRGHLPSDGFRLKTANHESPRP
jgi:hypothetical protein